MLASPHTRRRAEDARIDITSEHEVLHWARRFGVSRQELREAVHQVGEEASAVEAHLVHTGAAAAQHYRRERRVV